MENEQIFGVGLIPNITAIVTNRGRKTFGKGLLLDHKDVAKMQRSEQLLAVEGIRQRVFDWPYWVQLLALLHLGPLSDLSGDDKDLLRFASFTGKSQEHIDIQECIQKNPRLAFPALRGDIESSSCEYIFWSLDRSDVVTKTNQEWIGFEIKPSNSPFEELKKGLFQAVKYQALLKADSLAHGQIRVSRCVLVVGGSLPRELCDLADRLGVSTIENFSCTHS